MAREYLHHRHDNEPDDYPDGVFWLAGDSAAALTGDLAALAWLPELQLEERHLPEQELVAEAVVRRLRARERWLVVVDNLDKPVRPALDRIVMLDILKLVVDAASYGYANVYSLENSPTVTAIR